MTRQLQTLRPGQRFRLIIDGGPTYTGKLIYANPCRALVELDGESTTRTFKTRHDKTVTFTTPGTRRTSWAPECEVETDEVTA